MQSRQARLRERRKELADRHAEPVRDPVEGDKSHVELPGLDLLPMLQIESGLLLRLVEGESLRISEGSDPIAEFALHPPKPRGLPDIRNLGVATRAGRHGGTVGC